VDMTISRPIRIFALVALIAALGGGAMLMLKPKSNAAPPIVVNNAAAKPAPTTHPAATPAAPAKPTHGAATAKTSAPAKPAAKPAPKRASVAAIAANGFPMALAKALRAHAIVVVSVFDPASQTDAFSYSEAKAGAAEAGVGFVGISVRDSVAAGALTTMLPNGALLPSPGILVYRRPGSLVDRIDGFADRDAVAQAAVMSRTAIPLGG
jgi:hypothetical protein